jgi:hypothetical protein
MTYRFDPERPREPSAAPTVRDQTVPGPARSSDVRVRLCARALPLQTAGGPLAVHDDGLVLGSPAGLADGANEAVGPLRT